MNFGGLSRKPGANVFSSLNIQLENDNLVGVGCPARIVHNCVHHGCDQLKHDIEMINFSVISQYIQCAQTS